MNDCPFCRPNPSRVFWRGRLVYALWDGYPVNPGHALLIPHRHVPTWWDATGDERTELMAATDEVRRIIEETHRPDGYNLGVNAGEAAGQTIQHLHVHLIPRYEGDLPDPTGGVRAVIPHKANYRDRRPEGAPQTKTFALQGRHANLEGPGR